MLVDKLVKIKIHPSNFKWFKEKGYYPFKKNDIIEIDINDLMPSSKHIVRCLCEKCKEIKEIKYQNYKVQISRGGYYVCIVCSKYKMEETNIMKYGHKSALCNIEIREKSIKSMIKLYGVDNISKVEEIKAQRSLSMSYNYESMIKSFRDKYNIDNPSQLDWVKEKKIKTSLKNNGVENPSQNSEIFEKSQKSGKKIKLHENGLMYRGTYEKDFLDFCVINNIEVKKGPTIPYIYNNSKKYYHSDFIIPNLNLICEIKSSYYLDLYEEINQAKKKHSETSYNFIFIINKDYRTLLEIINS